MPTFDLDAMRSLRSTSPATNIVTTYQGLGLNAERIGQHVASRRTLVIMDELHHAAHGASWGDSSLSSFESATYVLKLTGTPFRSDDNKIIWLDYSDDGKEAFIDEEQSYILGYGKAVEAGYCRAVAFDRWSPAGGVTMIDSDGEEESFGSMEDMDTKTRKIALSTMMGWVQNEEGEYPFLESYLMSSVETLKEVKTHAPDAGGLVVAASIKHAKLIANMLAKMTGEEATIVHSEMPNASQVIDKFAVGYGGSWLVSVNMVSEGTDVPRLRVLAFASRVRSMLYFRQVMGRIVRKQVAASQGDDARCLIVDVAPWNQYAEEIENEIGYRLGKRILGEALNNPAGADEYTDVEKGTADILQEMLNSGFQQLDADGNPVESNTSTSSEVNSDTFIIGNGERQSGVFRGETLNDHQLLKGELIRNSRIANATTEAARSLARSISPHGWYLLEQTRDAA
jgi:type I site-specific restriction endonuclease